MSAMPFPLAAVLSRFAAPRFPFLLALAFAVLLHASYAPPPSGGFQYAVHWLVVALVFLGLAIVGVAIFAHAERSDGRT